MSDAAIALGVVLLTAGAAFVHVSLAFAVGGVAAIGYGMLLGLSSPKGRG